MSFQRQQQKIVNAINTMDADIVSLEEIENSVKLLTETDRDDALNDLVTALNAAAGETRWAFAPTPPAAELPTVAEQDVIRNAFIYDPATVELVGESDVLTGSAAFANAREPLAQAFKASGGADEDAFAVIVNHFKSKGSGVDDGHRPGQRQPRPHRPGAGPLAHSPTSSPLSRGTEAVFLTGDFNSYSKEDPIQVLDADGLHEARVRHGRRDVIQLRGPLRVARPRARQPRSARPRDGRRHLGDERQRVGCVPVQPLQLQRHAVLRGRQPVRRLRPQPRDRRPRRGGRGRDRRDPDPRHQRLPRTDPEQLEQR
ncbi:MAG: hypothetical protein WKF58_09845 [Ilumatobacteraceae bacterium]